MPNDAENPSLIQALDQLLAVRTHDAEFMAWKLATETTAAYINEKMFSVRLFSSHSATARNDFEGRNALLDHALRNVTVSGSHLQFGVHQGTVINFISRVLAKEQLVHGFGSFETLGRERIFGRKKQDFSRPGELPQVNGNVRLHQGELPEVLSKFLKEELGGVAFVHFDCEDYKETAAALKTVRDRIVPGTVLMFEEYFNFPGWEQYAYKAFQEFMAETELQYEYIGCAPRHYSVAVKLFARK